MTRLHERIIEISKKHGLSHNGSCLTSVGIIDEIYSRKAIHEPFVLSAGHYGLALYVVLEKYYGFDAEELYLKHGTHPNRDLSDRIYCSTGSLGQGLAIACGMALADRKQNVYCLISDGESFEGIIWEVSNVIEKYSVENLKVYCNWNGLSAYDKIPNHFMSKLKSILPSCKVVVTSVKDFGFEGLEAHYNKI